MKTALKKIFALGLLCAVAFLPLHAQTNDSDEPSTKSLVELEKKKIENEKDIAESRIDAQRLMVHDLAWNSWVLFAIAALVFGSVKNKRRHETIRLMVEKGTPLSPEVLGALQGRSRLRVRANYDKQGYLSWGLTLVAVGVGLLIISGKVGWIVLLIGVVDLILWAMDRGSSNNTPTT